MLWKLKPIYRIFTSKPYHHSLTYYARIYFKVFVHYKINAYYYSPSLPSSSPSFLFVLFSSLALLCKNSGSVLIVVILRSSWCLGICSELVNSPSSQVHSFLKSLEQKRQFWTDKLTGGSRDYEEWIHYTWFIVRIGIICQNKQFYLHYLHCWNSTVLIYKIKKIRDLY